ncbi:hypothetical protein [Geobacillus icigianus]|uniref:Uncharacterized protein n=1 Tax=Geobacillus icigianus TaxID=1430331 RepID=A0ABU6BKJ3_9BACL|nr:hypothetical protein [Geobacillus icigianus]MEB3752218.1 hypothetical protein [Geobacillus icigianus]
MGGINCDASNGRIRPTNGFADLIAKYTSKLFASQREFNLANELIELSVIMETKDKKVAKEQPNLFRNHLRKSIEEIENTKEVLQELIEVTSEFYSDPILKAGWVEPFQELDYNECKQIWSKNNLIPIEDSIWNEVVEHMYSEGQLGFWKLQINYLDKIKKLLQQLIDSYRDAEILIDKGTFQYAMRDLEINSTPYTVSLVNLWSKSIIAHSYMCLLSYTAYPSVTGVKLEPSDFVVNGIPVINNMSKLA